MTAHGRDPAPLAGKIAEFAARRVRSGERFAGRVPVRDALSDESRRRHGYHVTSLSGNEDDKVGSDVLGGLRDPAPSPAEEVCARLDVEAWLDGLDGKPRAVAEGFRAGARREDLARQLGVTTERIRQIRAALRRNYEEFQGGRER